MFAAVSEYYLSTMAIRLAMMSMKMVRSRASGGPHVARRVEFETTGETSGEKGLNSRDSTEGIYVKFNSLDVVVYEKSLSQCKINGGPFWKTFNKGISWVQIPKLL